MAAPHFIVHDTTDSVGVIVVEGIKKGQTLTGWVMATDDTIKLACLDAVPIGHKVALKPMSKGETVIKYGHDIGKVVRPIKKGGHVHIHNIKTKRW